MDWDKIKNIIIINLLILNIIIGYIYFQGNSYKSNKNLDNKVIYGVLKDNNIDLNIDESKIKNFPNVKVQYINAFNFFDYVDSKYKIISDQKYILKLVLTEEELQKYYIYKNNKEYLYNIYEEKVQNQNLYKDIVELFLNTNKLYNKNYEIQEIKKINILDDNKFEDNYVSIECIQIFDEYFLDGAYMKFLLKNDEVIYFEMKWCNIEYIKNDEILAINKNIAFYKLMREIMSSNFKGKKNIISVKRGYTFNNFKYNSELVEGEVFPLFRFVSEDGDIYDINAMSSY